MCLLTWSKQQHTEWGHPFWPLVLCLWQLWDDGITVQLWVKNLNDTFSKFGLGKLWFKAIAESQKILCSGSGKAWSLSAFKDNLIWESKGGQSPSLQRNWLSLWAAEQMLECILTFPTTGKPYFEVSVVSRGKPFEKCDGWRQFCLFWDNRPMLQWLFSYRTWAWTPSLW